MRKFTMSEKLTNEEKHERKLQRRNHRKLTLQRLAQQEDHFLDECITTAEDERTVMAKNDASNSKKRAIDAAHNKDKPSSKPGYVQRVRNATYAATTICNRALGKLLFQKRVSFWLCPESNYWGKKTASTKEEANQVLVTYDSGADSNYINEADRKKAGMPILRASTKRVRVANGETCNAKHVTTLPFPQLSEKARQADTFENFPTSLMSVGKTSDDDTISVFTKTGVSVFKEEDVLITCKGKPILIGKRDEEGRYRIPLMQQKGQWQPRRPSKRACKFFQEANSVYDLPSTEQAIKWMHAVCGYPVKSTWMKAVAAGNYIGWPMLTVKNVNKYYPETNETSMGHLNQTRRNVRSTRPLEMSNTKTLRGKKKRDVYMSVYNTRETICTDQTGQFPTRSQRGNKYIMVMVEIDSNAILVEPMTSRKDAEMIRAYDTLITRLQRAGSAPTKHVLDNEISENMKAHIRDTCKMQIELVPPGCHRRNAAEVAIRNFKAHFLSVLAGVADDFPMSLWDRLLPQTEITLNLIRQSNATPTVSAYAHLCGPFDYNKMPMAPMGCNVQVHEKADSRGTWAYHTVDGWYINTSPEHYRTHTCHIKETRSERFSDTVDFKHKRITNPSITNADKVMEAIREVVQTIKGLGGQAASTEAHELQRLVDGARSMLETTGANRNSTNRPPTVPRGDNHHQYNTRSQMTESAPRVSDGPAPRVSDRPSPTVSDRQRSKRSEEPSRHRRVMREKSRSETAHGPPASRTRLQRARAAAAPPAMNTRQRKSLLTIPLRAKPRAALAATTARRHDKSQLRRLTQRISRAENEAMEAMAVMDATTGKMMNYRQLMRSPSHKVVWSRSSANEFGRLAQGVGGRIKGTNTITFIRKSDVPHDRRKDVTYGQFVCTIRPGKDETHRTRFTVGGDRVNYPGEVATPTADMMVAKLLFNSIISTPKARFMTMDISNFYLMTPLKRKEYIRMKISDIPEEIIIEYKLRELVTEDGSIYIQANKGMYGLPQSGLLANELLEKRLNKQGYRQSKLVPGLWKHDTRQIQFTLVVDDFGVKYVDKADAQHLQQVLEEYYKITMDWEGRRYIGITLDWDYKRRQVHLSMPGYIKAALVQFQHKLRKKRHSPFQSAPIQYGAKAQYATTASTAEPVDAKTKKFIQQVCGKFLFLGRAVDSTLLCPISAIASQSAAPTRDTLDQTNDLLDYLATQEEAVLTYTASEMVIAVHSDASYNSEPRARSRAGGHFFLSSNAAIPQNNGAILNIAHIIKHVMTSATEAELAALYIMAREAVYIRIILEEMGHKQPPTPLQTDNSMAEAVINGKITPKRTKAMDMRFHWLRDRECQEQFRIYWRPGKLNYADYWTKHHPAKHHQNIRNEFLTPQLILEMLRQEQSSHTAKAA